MFVGLTGGSNMHTPALKSPSPTTTNPLIRTLVPDANQSG
jgi:hypothetical protein